MVANMATFDIEKFKMLRQKAYYGLLHKTSKAQIENIKDSNEYFEHIIKIMNNWIIALNGRVAHTWFSMVRFSSDLLDILYPLDFNITFLGWRPPHLEILPRAKMGNRNTYTFRNWFLDSGSHFYWRRFDQW